MVLVESRSDAVVVWCSYSDCRAAAAGRLVTSSSASLLHLFKQKDAQIWGLPVHACKCDVMCRECTRQPVDLVPVSDITQMSTLQALKSASEDRVIGALSVDSTDLPHKTLRGSLTTHKQSGAPNLAESLSTCLPTSIPICLTLPAV